MTDDGLVVRVGEPVARHTPWRTGGDCAAWVVALDEAAVVRVLADCRAAGWPVQVLGAGTRVVYRDGAVPGVVLRLAGAMASWRFDGEQVFVGAGAPVPALVAAAAARGLAGLEGMACTPGSVGAALLFDDAWGPLVASVRTVLRDKVVDDAWAAVRARKHSVVLGATLQLTAAAPAEVRRRVDQTWLAGRPVPPGSWYGPVKKGSVREVLKSVQLPLVRLRRVSIPDAAPECLVNLGGGTASDLLLLHKSALDRVKKVRGMDLVSHLRWVGSRGEEGS